MQDAVLANLAEVVCTPRRVEELRKRIEGRGLTLDDLGAASRALVTADHDVGRAYVMHPIDRVELYDDRATVVPRMGRGAEAHEGAEGLTVTPRSPTIAPARRRVAAGGDRADSSPRAALARDHLGSSPGCAPR